MKYTFDGVFLPNIKYGNFISEEGPDVEILVDSSAVPPDQETIIREDENGNCKVFTIQKLNPINAKKIIAFRRYANGCFYENWSWSLSRRE